MIKINSYKLWKTRQDTLGVIYRSPDGSIDYQNDNDLGFYFDIDFGYLKENNISDSVYRVNYYYSKLLNKKMKIYFLNHVNLKESENALESLLKAQNHLQLKFIKSVKC